MNLLISSFNRQLFILGFILVFGALFLPAIVSSIKEKQEEATQIRLEKAHQQVLVTFQGEVEKFATLMSGIRAYIVSSPEFPSQEDLRDYVAYQLADLNYADDLIISFIDTAHIFKYSFDLHALDPAGLVGTSVREIRDKDEINRLKAVMTDEHLHLFRPINLVEGLVGIPINFSVVRKGQVLGYIAAVIDFKTLIEPLYRVNQIEEYAYHFSVDGQVDFDRRRVYDGSQVYHDENDPFYYKNYNLEAKEFQYSELNLYGLNFKIGSAAAGALDIGPTSDYLSILLYGWYSLLIAFFGFSVYRLIKFQKLNIRLQASNQTIRLQTIQLESQNDELKQVVHTKDKLFSIIGHDLRSPLNSLITIISLAEADKITAEETKNFVNSVGTAARHNLSLLENLLRWSLQSSGAENVKKVDLSIHDLVRDTVDQMQVVGNSKDLMLVTDIDKKLFFNADFQMVSTILRNLISNAIKFSHPGSSITLRARIEKGTAVISVSDTGVGMNKEELNALFKAGADVVRRGTNEEPGTGLGLVVVKDFVKRHKGEIKVYSEEGKGSTFEVWLPNAWYEAGINDSVGQRMVG